MTGRTEPCLGLNENDPDNVNPLFKVTGHQGDTGTKVPVSVLNDLWEEHLIRQGMCWGRVISNSMYPVMRKGDEILVERVPLNKVHFGDIVVFRRNGRLVTHRLLGKRQIGSEYYIMEKGDAMDKASLIPTGSIIGRVAAIRKPAKVIKESSASGRLLQLLLAGISYFSFRLRTLLTCCPVVAKCFPFRGRGAYNNLFTLLRTLLLLPWK